MRRHKGRGIYRTLRVSSPVYVILLTLIVCLAAFASPAVAGEVKPLKPGRAGTVTPLPENKKPGTKEVVATGKSTIVNGNIERAKREALMNAYRFAVNSGVGVQIGELFVMKNFQEFNDVILKKSMGYVRSYEVLSEGVDSQNPSEYEMIIRAVVVEGNIESKKDDLALELYLNLLGRPRIMVLLDSDPASAYFNDSQEMVAAGIVELEIAKQLKSSGYDVITADDILSRRETRSRPLSGNEVSTDDLIQARKGVTSRARLIGQIIDADLVLCGKIESVSETVLGYGPQKVLTTSGIKTVVISTGQTINVDTYKVEEERETLESARSRSLDRLCSLIANDLKWRLPDILGDTQIDLRLTVNNLPLNDVLGWKDMLLNIPDVETALQGEWQRGSGKDRGQIVFTLKSSFMGIRPPKLFDMLKSRKPNIQPVEVGRYDLTIELP